MIPNLQKNRKIQEIGPERGARGGPGSAAHHFVLRCARETGALPTCTC